ncbi:hypothetical protein TBLA_0F00460 [Henningerozyma blattae CBS 6284]|uniref:Uncharacterized protein n=1 Tax=Henningerozyma blattae (strain ATCC 34711 / CBS 6284 / DSM 70876 / NBRC 10599 / NRRL Y-10934 / UCD 77-7) TaxID=1071380 RepID=I2H5D8_HENB6|nr:hypothetical protein TBLA_0F00460 [Tetrapisispora blattae CBS 6284]CCH61590.1 hypothetical protein TBLA_0F00460 [Tetrapisispora blattae CBS 6284]
MSLTEEPRIVSNPIDLQPLSLVKKQNELGHSSGSNSTRRPPPALPRKKSSLQLKNGIHIPIQPQSTPTKDHSSNGIDGIFNNSNNNSNIPTPVKSNNVSNTPGMGPSTVDQELLYKLAEKKRQIFELKQNLSNAEIELKEIEKQLSISQNSTLADFTNKPWLQNAQKTFNEIKTKKSISNFFNNMNSSTDNLTGNNNRPPKVPPKRTDIVSNTVNNNNKNNSIFRENSNVSNNSSSSNDSGNNTRSINNNSNRNSTLGSFNFKSIMNKINEYTKMDQADEEDFDKLQDKDIDKLYKNQRLAMDSDEEEEDLFGSESDLDPNDSSLLEDMDNIPESIFRR